MKKYDIAVDRLRLPFVCFVYAVFTAGLCISSVAQAKQLRIAIGTELPPYVFNQMSSGIEVDIIREALKIKGHTVSFHFVTNLRLVRRLQNRDVDGTAENSFFDIGKEVDFTIYDSDTTITYHNFAIAFDYKKFKIQSINDLINKRVLAFQNATKYLGTEYAKMAEKNHNYREHAKQSLQVKQLYAGRVEVVISEKRIFNYWKNQAVAERLLSDKNIGKKLKFHNIFKASKRNVKFVDRSIRDDFNQGLRLIKASGLYQDILYKYEHM